MWTNATSYMSGLEFNHLAGLLKLTISGLYVNKEMYLKVTSSENIAGTATADLGSTSTKPYLAIQDAGASKEIKVTGIKLSPEGSTATTATATFYVPLPVATLGTLTVGIYDSTDDKLLFKEKTWTNVAVARASIRYASFGFEVFDLTDTSSTKTISDVVKDAVNNVSTEEPVTTTVEIQGQLDTSTNTSNATISIPAVENKNVDLVFASAPTTSAGNELTIQDADTEAEQKDAVNTITVSLPATSSSVDMNINTPQSTVELKSNATDDSKTTYTTITATTANNTLVVGDKVEIGTINVKAGNIRLKKGSKVTTITRDGSYSGTLYIYKEAGASYDGTGGENVEVITDAQDANLETVLAKGGSYILPADITLTKPLVVSGKDVTIDLNGFNISANGALEQVLNTKEALILVRRGANLTIKDTKGTGSIDASKIQSIYAAVKLTDTNDGNDGEKAVVTVENGTLKGYYYAVAGNGNRHNTEINIKGGTLEGVHVTAIYHPQNGVLNITGGDLLGSDTGVELRSGELNISGGRLTSKATAFSEKANGNGTTIVGAALAISQHTTEKDIKVTISDGEFDGIYAIYEKDLQNPTGNVSLSATGGTFTGGVFSVHGSDGFITAGDFNDISAVNYIADGGNINVTLDKDASMEYFNLASGKTATIDLNGKTLNLTGDASKSLINGTVVFKNGTIEVVEAAKQKHTIWGDSNCNLTLDNVTMNGGHWALLVQGPNAKILVNKSTINAKYFPFSTNASGSEDGSPSYGANATIILKNSDFIATETGFMNNVPADVTIDGCKFYGNHQAALLRGGKFTITNSTFTLKAELDDSDSENNHFKKGVTQWADGNRCAFAGITIGNFGNSSYQYETTVKMTGVTINVEGTYKDKFPALHACANSADGKGVTITYADSQFNSSYTPAIEFGTTNIKVNGVRVVESEGSFVVPTSTSAE